MFNPPNISSRTLLLSGASLAAILLTAPMAHAATLAGLTGRTATQINMTPPPVRPTGANGVTTPGQAAAATSQSSRDFSTALAAVQAQLAGQAAARNAAAAVNLGPDPNHPGQQLPNVPDGLTTGGLVAHNNPSQADVANGLVWQNANAPTQTTANGKTTVTVQQTAQKAILTWDSFNVGKNTTVHFDQSAGTQASDGSNQWIALNRVIDPSDVPSQILGQIKAEGTVYLINKNGIIFGGSSQVNVHSLIVSTLPILAGFAGTDNIATQNNVFIVDGIASETANEQMLGSGAGANVHFDGDNGRIDIQQGAHIETGEGGFSLIAAPNLTNEGEIVANGGTITLAASRGVSGTPTAPQNVGWPSSDDAGAIYTLTNTGSITSVRGAINLLGTNINQDGLVLASTSISQPGSISILAEDEIGLSGYQRAGNAIFGPGSVTAILPDEDGETTTSSAAANADFNAGSINIAGYGADFQSNSLLEAPGAAVSVGNIFLDAGASLDVAGLTNVELPMSDNLVTVARVGQNELADSPVQRNGVLYKAPITVDARDSGTRQDGEAWTGTPVANVTSYVLDVTRDVSQMLVNGGTITASQIIAKPTSVINIAGGYTHYDAGYVQTTRLIGSDGNVYSVADADPNMTYTGLAGVDTVDHNRWVVSQTYTNSLLNGAQWETDYIQGGNGGTLNLKLGTPGQGTGGNVGEGAGGANALILDGDIYAGALTGRYQIGAGSEPLGGTFNLTALGINITDDGVSLADIAPDITYVPIISLDGTALSNSSLATPGMLAKSPGDPTNVLWTANVSSKMLDDAGFSSLNFTGDKITLGSDALLSVAPGGSVSMTAGRLDIFGSITAHSGQISLVSTGQTGTEELLPFGPVGGASAVLAPATPPSDHDQIEAPVSGDITIGSNSTLDVSGLWVNDAWQGMDQQTGDAFVNGGSITIQTQARAERGLGWQYNGFAWAMAAVGAFDTTGNIILSPGSVLNASSGGYVGPTGQLAMKNGLPLGQGGNISLQTYVPTGSSIFQVGDLLSGGPAIYQGAVPPASDAFTQGAVQLGGTLEGYGFAGGGTLSIQTLGIQIGGDPASAPSYALWLPAEYFASQGFGGYNLSAMYDATIASGTQVAVSQRDFVPDLATIATLGTGADLYNSDQVSLGTVPAYYRQPTGFSLSAGGYLRWNGTSVTAPLYTVARPSFIGVAGSLLLDDGASITADAGADVSLSSYGQLTDLGSIAAPGGDVNLTVLASSNGLTTPYSMNRSVWLGPDASIDVSGVALLDPYATPVVSNGQLVTPRTGKVLEGGDVSITGVNAYLVAEPGATIKVSGADTTLDIAQNGSGIGSVAYAPTDVASDAGSITLGSTSGVYFDGNLLAQGGNASAEGGTLTLLGLQASDSQISSNLNFTTTEIMLQQSGNMVPAWLKIGAAVESGTTPSGIAHFAADRLNGSGIDTLVLGNDPATNGLPSFAPAITVAFAGNVALNLGRAVIANANNYETLNADGTTPSTGSTVGITAPYVALNGDYASALTPSLQTGAGVLNVNAQNIDLTGQFELNGIAAANFDAAGDIRLYNPANYAYVGNSQVALPGELLTAGNLSFTAAELYPATDSVFIVDAPMAGASITINGNGASQAPISAGGALLFDAASIVQDGTVRAPSGTIQLGVGDPTDADTLTAFNNLPLIATTSVTLGDGSLTSVSLDGANVPYGTTTDGTDWKLVVQNSLGTTTSSADLTNAPSKFIGISAANVDMASGSTVDLTGGGSVYAQEWVPGTGGSRDLLTRVNTSYSSGATPTQTPLYPDDRPIYAVIPGYNSPVAPYDPSFGYTGSAVGQSVYLSGVKGLPDGVYTLLPAQYATVPGAFRVVQQTATQDSVSNNNATLGDGSQVVAGRFVDGITGKEASRSTSFLVQSGPVWQQYSEYTITSADTYFPAQAANAGTDASRTPVDAGQLAIAATNSLVLNASFDAAGAKGGRGAEVDIASQDIQIVGDGAPALSGYLQVDATSLSNLGVESLLIGGTRSDTVSGIVITPIANSVVLSNDASSALTGPEILLVIRTDTSGTDPNAANGLVLDPGSVIGAKGSIATTSTAPILIGNIANNVSGDGALVRVSNGVPVAIARANVPGQDGVAGTATGLLNIEAGATVNGGKAATLDASGNLLLDPTAIFTGANVQLDTASAAFVAADSNANPSGLVVGPALLAQLANIGTLGINARGAIGFYGDVALDVGQNLTLGANVFTSDGGNVTITAPVVALVNTGGSSSATASDGTGTLTISTGELDFGAGAKVLQGFESLTATATSGIAGQGSGSLDAGNATVSLTAPIVMADSGAVQSLTTTGAVTLNNGAGTAISREAMGGTLKVTGGSIATNANLQAIAGNLTLEATSGDVDVNSGASLSAAGVNKTFYDTVTYAPGGTLSLTSDHGAIAIVSGATLNVAGGSQGGDAGSLVLNAAGTVTLDGSLAGQVTDPATYRGGIFHLTSGGAVDLDRIADLASQDGMTGAIVVTSGEGNLLLSAGKTLTARNVYLTANGGDGHPDPNNGNLILDGTIDISGTAAGMVTLYGKSGVDIEGQVLATSSTPEQLGGIVTVGTSGAPDGTINATYGYENVQPGDSGTITMGPHAVIDVSGGSADSGGTVSFRAPLLANGDLNIVFNGGGANIKGARTVTIEPYAVWSTTDAYTDAAKHFDGIIDPSGYYQDANGGAPHYVSGTWTDASGNILPAPTDDATLKIYQANDYFTPDTANADHQTFYGYVNGDAATAQPGTLMAYVENPGYSFGSRYANIANLQIAPGIVLENPDLANNAGAISILTNWNLGAGTDDGQGHVTQVFRYNGIAPILSVLAAGNLNINASITDGFYQQNDGVALADPVFNSNLPPAASPSSYDDALDLYSQASTYLLTGSFYAQSVGIAGYTLYTGAIYDTSFNQLGDLSQNGDPYYHPLQAPLTNQTQAYYDNYMKYIADFGSGQSGTFSYLFNWGDYNGFKGYNLNVSANSVAPQPSNFTTYAQYATAYQSWLTANFNASTNGTPSPLLQPILGSTYTAYSSDYGVYATDYLSYLNYVAFSTGDVTAFGESSQLFYAPFAPSADPGKVQGSSTYANVLGSYEATANALAGTGIWSGTINLAAGGTASITADPYYSPITAPLANQSNDYYANYQNYLNYIGLPSDGVSWSYFFQRSSQVGFLPLNPTTLAAPQPASYSTYAAYASAYQAWLQGNFGYGDPHKTTSQTPSPILLPLDDGNYTDYSTDYTQYIAGFKAYVSWDSTFVTQVSVPQLFYAPLAPASDPSNTIDLGTLPIAQAGANNNPDNQPVAGNPIPLYAATLLGGSSSSYRLVAGADLASADPQAVNALAANGSIDLDGHLSVKDTATTDADGNPINTRNPNYGKTLVFPEVIRTGTGDIDLAASGDIAWQDDVAPAAIYAAGEPDPDAPVSASTDQVNVVRPNSAKVGGAEVLTPEYLVSGPVNPEHGGNISLNAGGDILGIQDLVDTDGTITGTKGTMYTQYWTPWLETGNVTKPIGQGVGDTQTSINFSNFDQGVMSVGGDVEITAGGNISELAVSLPTTWFLTGSGANQAVNVVGGGDLSVQAGGNILSGDYFVSKGTGTITTGQAIGSAFNISGTNTNLNVPATYSSEMAPLLGAQDTVFNISARGDLDIAGVYNPSMIQTGDVDTQGGVIAPDMQSYSTSSALHLSSTGGNVAFDTLTIPGLPLTIFGAEAGNLALSNALVESEGAALPATFTATALQGGIAIDGDGVLYPSAISELSLIADDTIAIAQEHLSAGAAVGFNDSGMFGMSDEASTLLASPLNPTGVTVPVLYSVAFSNQLQVGLHDADTLPVRIYSLNGDIVDGHTEQVNAVFLGLQTNSLKIVSTKPAQIRAGRDIVSLNFLGQNLYGSDVTSIIAGRDIYDVTIPQSVVSIQGVTQPAYGLIQLGGPGTLDMEAGRNLGPLSGDLQDSAKGYPTTGIQAIGNLDNPTLPRESADISVLFGTGPGVAWDSFANAYLNPDALTADVPNVTPDLIQTVEQYEADQDKRHGGNGVLPTLSADQAWAAYQTLPQAIQQAIVQKEFFSILQQVGQDYNNPDSPDFGKYARGYQAINILFPSALGYTANELGGGTNGSNSPITTGNLDIRNSTIQTEQGGGNIDILGPGGQLLVGSTASPPYQPAVPGNNGIGPESQGIIAWETGAIDIYSDESLLLAQSRVFTQQGGDMTIWSSNGDINAGKGAKTTVEVAPITYLCDEDGYCRINSGQRVTGAGIAAFPAKPGDPDPVVTLVAPRGTVDAGDAGIRVAGDLFIAALAVANADNIQVTGKSVGLPPTPVTNLSLTTASTAATEAAAITQSLARQQPANLITVEVTGFGGQSAEPEDCIPSPTNTCAAH